MTPASLLTTERAIEDFRRGMPIWYDQNWLVLSAEEASNTGISYFTSPASLILSPLRAQHLYGTEKPLAIDLPLAPEMIAALIGARPVANLTLPTPHDASNEQAETLALAKKAQILPAVIIAKHSTTPPAEILALSPKALHSYKKTLAHALRPAIDAPLTLRSAPNHPTHIVAYRPDIGGAEHYALIIGEPMKDNAPLVRIHSSCFTGDLLGSLACDCGEQLQSAIALMDNEPHGGIILYLMQEGRGIGLINKLRTYDLQAQGHDTVEANRMLGFDDDERLFDPAAAILHSLEIKEIRLLSNNPRKAKGLESLGIKVTECVPHQMEANPHNAQYLQTKAEKLGHTIR